MVGWYQQAPLKIMLSMLTGIVSRQPKSLLNSMRIVLGDEEDGGDIGARGCAQERDKVNTAGIAFLADEMVQPAKKLLELYLPDFPEVEKKGKYAVVGRLG